MFISGRNALSRDLSLATYKFPDVSRYCFEDASDIIE